MCACTWLMKLVVSRHWLSSLALIFQAWPHTLILRSSLRRGVNMRSQWPFFLCKGSTFIYTYGYDWIGLPFENWCMCVCIVWIRYLELIMESLVVDQTLWWWQEVRRKGETKNQQHGEFQAVLSVKQGRHWCQLAIEVRPWSRVYESLNLILRLINPLANP